MSVAFMESELVSSVIDNITTFGLPANFNIDDDIHYPMAPFKTPNDKPWLRLTLHINDRTDVDANQCRSHLIGIFNVQVNYPREVGSLTPAKIADRICHFFNNNYTGAVYIEQSLVRPIYGEEWATYNVQVSVRFEVDNTNEAYL